MFYSHLIKVFACISTNTCEISVYIHGDVAPHSDNLSATPLLQYAKQVSVTHCTRQRVSDQGQTPGVTRALVSEERCPW